MREIYANNKIFVHKLVLLLIIAVFVILGAFLVGYVAPFVAGYIISLVLSPLVGLLHRRFGVHRGVSAAVLILALMATLTVLGSLILSRIIAEMAAFMLDIPTYIAGVQEIFDNLLVSMQNLVGTGFEIDFAVLLNPLLALATGLLQDALDGGGFFVAIPVAILRTIIAVVSAFFFIKDKELIKVSIAALLPKKLVAYAKMVRDGILKALAGYMKGQLIVMAFVAAICVVGLTIIGSPYSLFIGIGIAIFDLIPIFGAGGILIPWAVYHFLDGNASYAIGLLIIYGVVFIVRQTMESKVVGDQIGMHPIILLVSIYVGITTMGPIGFLAGPLIMLTIKTIMETNLTSD